MSKPKKAKAKPKKAKAKPPVKKTKKPNLKIRKKVTPKKRKPRAPDVPKGFKRIHRRAAGPLPDNIATIQRTAADQARASLIGAARQLDREGRVTTAVHVHANRDGTVDGELRVANIKRGYKIVDLLTDISLALHGTPDDYSEWKLPEGAGFWVSIGALTDWGGSREDWTATFESAKKRGATDSEARQIANGASSPLPRYRGQSRVALYPQRIENLPANIVRAQDGLLGEAHRDQVTGRKLGRKGKSKPNEILVRVYWNPWDKSPKNMVGGRGASRPKRR